MYFIDLIWLIDEMNQFILKKIHLYIHIITCMFFMINAYYELLVHVCGMFRFNEIYDRTKYNIIKYDIEISYISLFF